MTQNFWRAFQYTSTERKETNKEGKIKLNWKIAVSSELGWLYQ